MFRRASIAMLLAVLAGGCLWMFPPILAVISDGVTGTHQRSITKEISAWGHEYSNITDDDSAIRAARMVGYIKDYYVPVDDIYRSTPEIESALAEARESSLTQIVGSLEAYTGLGYGLDDAAWDEWADSLANLPHAQDSAQPESPHLRDSGAKRRPAATNGDEQTVTHGVAGRVIE